jgi:hypothetical protein
MADDTEMIRKMAIAARSKPLPVPENASTRVASAGLIAELGMGKDTLNAEPFLRETVMARAHFI